MKIRKASVSGTFYPADKTEIVSMLNDILEKEKKNIDISLSKQKIIGGVVPHAGYVYSAYQAVHFFEIIKNSKENFDTIIIINPNHTGQGTYIALDENTKWESPFGITDVDMDFVGKLDFPISAIAHKHEHSGEVMLPMLNHFLNYDFKIVPITLTRQDFKNASQLAKAIFEANKKLKKRILIIASSDFSHQVTPDLGEKLDEIVIKEILNLDSKKVYEAVTKNNISICGFGPIMTLIEYSKLITKKPKADILRKGNSGDIYPSAKVVDYVSILFREVL